MGLKLQNGAAKWQPALVGFVETDMKKHAVTWGRLSKNAQTFCARAAGMHAGKGSRACVAAAEEKKRHKRSVVRLSTRIAAKQNFANAPNAVRLLLSLGFAQGEEKS